MTEGFVLEMWKRMEKISWTDHDTNKEGLEGIGEERAVIHTIKRDK